MPPTDDCLGSVMCVKITKMVLTKSNHSQHEKLLSFVIHPPQSYWFASSHEFLCEKYHNSAVVIHIEYLNLLDY